MEFPEWVEISKCASRTLSKIHKGPHGYEQIKLSVDVSEHLYICRSEIGKLYAGTKPLNAVKQIW